MPHDETVDADESTLERIRRAAADADPSNEAPNEDRADDNDATVEASGAELRRISLLASEAVGVDDDAPTPPAGMARVDVDQPRPTARPIELDVDPEPVAAAPRPRPVNTDGAERWRPPARSMRPVVERVEPAGHVRWRIATIALSLIVLVLILWMFVAGGDSPADPDAPSDSVVATRPGEPGEIPEQIVIDPDEGGAGG